MNNIPGEIIYEINQGIKYGEIIEPEMEIPIEKLT